MLLRDRCGNETRRLRGYFAPTNPGVVSVMNLQVVRSSAADQSVEQSFPDRSSFPQRTASVAAAAAAEAEDVDRQARFPQAALDAARAQKLLGIQISQAFGGDGASMSDVTDMCYTLGRACSS